MDSPFYTDEELATATLGAIGIHYELPEEMAYMKSLAETEAGEYAEEMAHILMTGGNNLAFNLQSLRERNMNPEIRDEWVALASVLGASLMAASYFVFMSGSEEFKELDLHKVVMSPDQVEEMIGDDLNALLSENCDSGVLDDLSKARAGE